MPVLRFATVFAALLMFVAPGLAGDFPLIIPHKFGTTIIEQKPERVATLDYGGADNLLALGVQPVIYRYWFGDHERGVWPWADVLLQEGTPMLEGDLDFEQIAATEPDVIIALWSGIDAKDYERLSLIAPVVAVPEGVGDYALGWDKRALLTGKAIGLAREAETKVDAIRQSLQTIARDHPEWAGKSAAVAHAGQGPNRPSVYTSNDVHVQLIEQMGFVTPSAINDLVGDGDFVAILSPEDLSPLATDLLIWLTTDNWDNVRAVIGRPFLPATQKGQDVYLGPFLSDAFSHASLLSLPYAIEGLTPMIEAALDGDPTTHADERPTGW